MNQMQRQLPTIGDLVGETLAQLEQRRIHDADFELLGAFIRPDSDVLDIGANRGQSLVSLHVLGGHGARVHAFEANPYLFPVLEAVAARCDATLHPYGLGDAEQALRLYVPWASGVCYLEEASIAPSYFDKPWVAQKFHARGGLELDPVDIALRRGDSLALAPSLVKVDVEGAELRVLTGLEQTLRRHRPVILAENSDYHNVTAFLAGLGYAPFQNIDGTLVPLATACTNTFYLPRGE